MANAILAAVLSFLIPGLGQAYAGDIKKGAIFFIIAVVLAILSFFTAFLLSIISLIFAIYVKENPHIIMNGNALTKK